MEEELSSAILYNLNIIKHTVPCSEQLNSILGEEVSQKIEKFPCIAQKNKF